MTEREMPDLGYAAVLGYPVTIPGVEGAHIKPMAYKRAVYWTRQFEMAQTGSGGLWDTLDAFAAEVALMDGRRLEDLPLNAVEMFGVARDFLARVREPFKILLMDLVPMAEA